MCGVFLSSLWFSAPSAPPLLVGFRGGGVLFQRFRLFISTGCFLDAETAFLSAALTLSNFGAAVQQLDTQVSVVVFDSSLMIDGCRTRCLLTDAL